MKKEKNDKQNDNRTVVDVPENEEYRYELKIPKERVAVLIGKSGEVKSEIESFAKIKITVDSKEGDVFISGKDPIMLYAAKEVIKAVGRGFNPEIANLLFKQDYMFELMSILDFAKTKNDIIRLKGRIIGSGGKSRNVIEQLTETYICVYGKTVGIVGEISSVSTARRAIELLLEGSPHSNVFKFLEKERRKIKRESLQGGDVEIKEEAKRFRI